MSSVRSKLRKLSDKAARGDVISEIILCGGYGATAR